MNRISITLIIVVLLLATMMFTSCGESTEHVCSYDIKGATVKATCVSYGYTEYACECGKTVQMDLVDSASAHKFVESARVDATCSADGILTEACSICGTLKNTAIPATGAHAFEVVEVVEEATCERDGREAIKCTVCGYEDYRATTHEFTPDLEIYPSRDGWWVEKKPTCEEDGLEVAVCVCGAKATNTLPATGHDWSEWEVDKAATCVVDGTMKRTCACGKVETKSYSDPDAHTLKISLELSSEASCTTAGWVAWICNANAIAAENGESSKHQCDHVEYRDYVEAAHDFEIKEGTVIVKNPASCEYAGTTYILCNKGCGEKLYLDPTPATGHTYEVVKVLEPTCQTPGYSVYECKCGDTYKDDYTDPVDHDYVMTEWVDGAPAECFGTAMAKFVCACGSYKYAEATSEEHTAVVSIVVEPGKYTSGYEYKSCECGENYEFIGHKPAILSSDYKASVHKYAVGDGYAKSAVITDVVPVDGVVVIPCLAKADSATYYVEALDYSLFYGETEVTTLYLPFSITRFYTSAFWYAESIDTIYYEGTVEAWNNIQKELYWDRGMGDYKVVCLDGTINQYGTVTYND